MPRADGPGPRRCVTQFGGAGSGRAVPGCGRFMSARMDRLRGGGSYTGAMVESLLFGAVASSALLIGALVGVRFELPKRVLAILLSFAAGALITALAFELFEDAYEKGGIWLAVIGLFAGAVVFTVLSALLDRWAQPGPRSKDAEKQQGSVKLDTDAAAEEKAPTAASAKGAAGLALLAAVTLDGVPENVALGVSLTEGTGGLALLAAIFVSNLPEAIGASTDLRKEKRPKATILRMWGAVAVVCVLATMAGFAVADATSGDFKAGINGFAAGALLVMLVDSMIPEAREKAGRIAGLVTVLGFAVAAGLS